MYLNQKEEYQVVNELTIAVICLIALMIFLFFWVREGWFKKSSAMTFVAVPKVTSGRPIIRDSTNILDSYGEVIGGKMQTQDVMTLTLQSKNGEVTNHYNVNDFYPENIPGHLIGNERNWVYVKDYAVKFGSESERIIKEVVDERDKLLLENAKLKTENEHLNAGIDLYKDQVITDTERLAKASKPSQYKPGGN